MTYSPPLRTIATERTASQTKKSRSGKRPFWLQCVIVVGAFLSALGVLYASDVVPALGSAAVFFLFYRRLQPSSHVFGQEPVPDGPDKREERRTAA